MNKLFHWLIQGKQANTLENRLFNTALLMSMLFMFFSGLVNLSLNVPISLFLFNLLGLGLFFCLYISSRFWNHVRQARLLFVYFSLLLMSVAWFLNGGLMGSIPYIYLGLGVVVFAVLPLRDILIFWPVLVLDILGVSLLERLFPEWVLPYASDLDHRLDLILTLMAALMLMSASLYLFRLHYDREQRLLQTATEYKSRFMASMSHELRTPLNALIGFTRVLQKERAGPLTETQQQYLERMQTNGLHLLDLVNDMLDLARVEAGQMRAELRPVELLALLRDATSQFQAQAEALGLKMILELPETSAINLETDSGRLRQILTNLIGNAVKYTPQGQVEIRLFQSDSAYFIEVEDTGVGILPEHQALIFEPFYQIGRTSAGGVGLGLAITFQLCQLLGYRLSVKSETDLGSCFRVEIPRGV